MLSIPKFVINLKRRPDRLNLFLKRCPLDNVNIVTGFDGKNFTEEPLEDIKMFKKVQCRFPGEGGCYISHLRIFQDIVNKNYSHAFIMEDDAEFCNGFKEKYEIILKEIPEDTDILYIGGRFTPNFIMHPLTYIPVSSKIVRYNLDIPCNRMMMDRTTHAYIISNKMAKELLKEFHSQNVIPIAIDDWMLRYFRKNTQIYSAIPLLCHSPLVSDSDIR